MALFDEKDTRDELGLGPIRDSIADHLFPGTSTIQTRLRYMLFVPWIYSMLERSDGSLDKLKAEARAREIRLIDALRSGGEDEGIIGREAGASLKRLPSSIYWAGLQSWGIRQFAGSQEMYVAAVPSLRRHRRRMGSEDDARAMEEHAQNMWHPGLPPAPDDFLEVTSFGLTGSEAGFLVDRLVDSHPDSLLTYLVTSGRDADCEFAWLHPDQSNFPTTSRRLVDHANVFSAIMHSASLIYNLMLSELREEDDWIEHYRNLLSEWSGALDQDAVAGWSLDDFWAGIEHDSHRIREPARQFVRRWWELVKEDPGTLPDLAIARDLIRGRERRLKGAQSRFANRAALDRWGGSSGAGRLSFRWREAKSHIRDLIHAG